MALITCGLISLPVAASDAYGDPFEGSGFVSDDWHVVCDNTLTCRAAGYSEDGAELRGSILLTLKAGEKIATTQVLLNHWDLSEGEESKLQAQLAAADYKVGMWINDKSYGKVQLSADDNGVGELTHTQTLQLISNARRDTKIVFKLGKYQWPISDKGMAAVLLKLDDVQGRVGSPLALVSKESANRQKLKPATSLPKIYAVEAYAVAEYGIDTDDLAKMSDEQKFYQRLSERYDRQWQNKMTKWAIASLDAETREDCNVLTSDHGWFDKKDKVWRFTPIDNKHTLASHPCWTGAYNFGSGYWLINNDKPSKPELITISGSTYTAGEIFAAHKGRGLGDCWTIKEWVWDGKKFAVTSDKTTGLCRLIVAGGTWDMPTYVSEVIKNN